MDSDPPAPPAPDPPLPELQHSLLQLSPQLLQLLVHALLQASSQPQSHVQPAHICWHI